MIQGVVRDLVAPEQVDGGEVGAALREVLQGVVCDLFAPTKDDDDEVEISGKSKSKYSKVIPGNLTIR